MRGDYEMAAKILRERIALCPETDISRVMLASACGHLGLFDEARAVWRDVFRVNPSYSLEHRGRVLPYKDPADWERVLEGLAKAGLPD